MPAVNGLKIYWPKYFNLVKHSVHRMAALTPCSIFRRNESSYTTYMTPSNNQYACVPSKMYGIFLNKIIKIFLNLACFFKYTSMVILQMIKGSLILKYLAIIMISCASRITTNDNSNVYKHCY